MKCGDIYLVDFCKAVGHEYQGVRPAVIIQADSYIQKTNIVTVMPLTSHLEKKREGDILVKADGHNRLYRDSLIRVAHIKSFDRSRFIKKIGRIDDSVMLRIKAYLKKHFGV